MELLFPGILLRQERLRRNWSQEGLCKGICAVSYLSKIEQGKTQAGPEILRLLFARLQLPWYDDAPTLQAASDLVERCYETLFSCNKAAIGSLQAEFSAHDARLSHSPYAPDAALLRGLFSTPFRPADAGWEPLFSSRQLALQRMMQGRHAEAVNLAPCAYLCLMAGIAAYDQGASEAEVVTSLRRACDLAAEEGYAHAMLLARTYLGNFYCNKHDIASMHAHYRAARRLALALGEHALLRDIEYNQASAYYEAGEPDRAYAYFAGLEQPTVLELHKLAVCCEKLGRREEALSALNRAEKTEMEETEPRLARQMCGLVRFRLEHADYLAQPEYGRQLLQLFQQCRNELPVGYAAFHLPWVLEWHTAARQYRAAYELLRDFPLKFP